jgi:hypothetical protein
MKPPRKKEWDFSLAGIVIQIFADFKDAGATYGGRSEGWKVLKGTTVFSQAGSDTKVLRRA